MVQVDVFTDRTLTGNALAVFLDGRGLSTEQMQALARETNLSETTFILPGDIAVERIRGVRVRIFTVQEELPLPDIQRSAPRLFCVAKPARSAAPPPHPKSGSI
jgi:PhzF family phenazine biosynthesis protein